jgi:hypothetical protein
LVALGVAAMFHPADRPSVEPANQAADRAALSGQDSDGFVVDGMTVRIRKVGKSAYRKATVSRGALRGVPSGADDDASRQVQTTQPLQ